jgi:hypothetical protein
MVTEFNKIAFTCCSNNYLAQASILAETLKKENPNYKFYVFLVDRYSNKINYEDFPFTIIQFEELPIQDVDFMISNYNVIELNTSVKATAFKYLFKHFSPSLILFFDPDIYVFSKLDIIEQYLETNEIVLTPHITAPINQGANPNENVFLNFGIYNLGFIGLKNSPNTNDFLNWWESKLLAQCKINPCQGIFVDQLWINHAPIFFQNVFVTKHLGLNIAPWNLHERTVTKSQNKLTVNNDFDLIFFHFSDYNYLNPEVLSSKYIRNTFENNSNCVELYSMYHEAMIKHNIVKYSNIKCAFPIQKEKEEIKGNVFSIENVKKLILLITPPIVTNKIIQFKQKTRA